MLYLIVLCLIVAALVGPSGARALGRELAQGVRRRIPGSWRPGVGLVALAILLAALAAGVRGEWPLAIGGVLFACVAALTARLRPPPPAARGPRLSRREAADLLGLRPDADAAQIRAAHARLIRVAHPDRGGTAALAAQLNAARDILLARA